MSNRTIPEGSEPFCYNCHMGNASPCSVEHKKWVADQIPKGKEIEVLPNTRKAEILVGGHWSDVEFEDLKAGDLVRMFEPDGLPVEAGEISLLLADAEMIKTNDGKSMVMGFTCLPAGRKLEEEADAG